MISDDARKTIQVKLWLLSQIRNPAKQSRAVLKYLRGFSKEMQGNMLYGMVTRSGRLYQTAYPQLTEDEVWTARHQAKARQYHAEKEKEEFFGEVYDRLHTKPPQARMYRATYHFLKQGAEQETVIEDHAYETVGFDAALTQAYARIRKVSESLPTADPECPPDLKRISVEEA